MEDLLIYGSKSGFISFALGLPSMDFFPKNKLKNAAQEVVDQDFLAFQYAPPQEELKSQIVKLMKKRGINCEEKEIILTSGAQQGISILLRLLLVNNASVILEHVSYPGMLQALESYTPKIVTVSSDPETGMNVDEVLSILKGGVKPAFIYLVADGGNPLGVNLEINKRIELSRLSREYNIPIIEDDAYGFLRYKDNILPVKYYCGDNVFYIGSFSKIISPSLRVGWIVAPKKFISKLSSIKEGYDINTATFSQRIINNFLKNNNLDDHISDLCDEYIQKRDALVCALRKYFPAEVRFHIPQNGIFIWVELPKRINTTKLFNLSLRILGVAFIPSEYFSSTNSVKITNAMRVNFSHPSLEEIEEGVKKLGEMICCNKYFQA